MMNKNYFDENHSKNNDENQTQSNDYPEFLLPKTVRFWLLMIFEVPSVACSMILLYYLLIDRRLRHSLGNHVIIVLLIIGLFSQLIDIPFYLNYLRINYVWPSTTISCLIWWFAATGISNLTNIVMAWASIERHILVFHERWLSTKKKRLFIHYFPLLTIVLYGFIYYIIILSIFSCENMYAYELDWCLYPCYYNSASLAMYDTIANSIIPTPIITIFSIALIIRVIKQKHTLHRRFHWRKYRRMAIQILSITALFLLFNFPMTSLVLAHVCGLPNGSTGQFEFYAYYLYHFVSLLMPFVCLGSLPEIRKKMKRLPRLQRMINVITPRHASLR
ncbi:unnamed protein product [Rotaria sp. Silwood1]|nr:unnamed protein product [Rotaria sp. Silwood1]CAF1006869.1 unnamed protein product [Rotaria sp. Silwood1]CAF3398017.1 unnamed protein product [Rotaria sp. Silwood1]CAF3422202.1 unnamed protein product [Rotaria sp. Silwood1]CAF3424394.1 unnamed protein product [Rotaria sp. Silwood1]